MTKSDRTKKRLKEIQTSVVTFPSNGVFVPPSSGHRESWNYYKIPWTKRAEEPLEEKKNHIYNFIWWIFSIPFLRICIQMFRNRKFSFRKRKKCFEWKFLLQHDFSLYFLPRTALTVTFSNKREKCGKKRLNYFKRKMIYSPCVCWKKCSRISFEYSNNRNAQCFCSIWIESNELFSMHVAHFIKFSNKYSMGNLCDCHFDWHF